jgi:hypothetical protein
MKNEVKSIRVFDLLGKTVYSQELNSTMYTSSVQVDLSNLTDGNYVISLQNDNGVSNYEVIINR